MDYIKELSDLTSKVCISGDESEISSIFYEKLRSYTKRVYMDNTCNVFARMGMVCDNSVKIMLNAHMDQAGFMVSGIGDDGIISFISTTDIDMNKLAGSTLCVKTSSGECHTGLVPCKPHHVMGLLAKENSVKKEGRLDLGLPVLTVKNSVAIGDSIVFPPELRYMANGIVTSSAMDNRAGMVCLLSVAEQLATEAMTCEVVIAGTTDGLISGAGAACVAKEVEPEIAVIVDVIPEISEYGTIGSIVCNGGPVVCFGGNSSPRLAKSLIETAQENHIPIQQFVPTDDCETEDYILQKINADTSTLVVGIPIRYCHTQNEMISVRDLSFAAKLLTEWIRNRSKD